MPPPLAARDLWKWFGKTEAVNGISLEVPAGSVYGFLGPNGAGKSTTIRMMLGLLRPNKGVTILFGEPVGSTGRGVMRRVGSMVESPALYSHLTGRENLEVHRLLVNERSTSVDAALETVGLRHAATQLVRGYSSGMKQRLGLAIALLGGPELLILDEPTNALDPAGIHEVRNLIRQLPSRGPITVFLSSHLLAEVEQIATHVGIVAKGVMKFEGPIGQLRAKCRKEITIDVNHPQQSVALLEQAGLTVAVEGNRLRVAAQDGFEPPRINRMLVAGALMSPGSPLNTRRSNKRFLSSQVPLQYR